MTKKRKTRLFEGLPVVDATRKLRLEITGGDIEISKKANPAQCAAARAITRQFKTEARVFMTKTYVKQKNRWVRFETPNSIGREITAFDRGANFEAGEYTIIPVSPAARLGTHRKKNKNGKNHKHVTRKYHVTANVRSYSDNVK